MIEKRVPCLGLKLGVRVLDFATVEELENEAGERGAALRLANKYLVEKSALVDARDRIAEAVYEATAFPMLTASKKKSDGTVVEEVTETEVQYLARFRKAVLAGDIRVNGFNKDTLEDDLQMLVDKLGAFKADAKRPERGPAKPKLGKWLTERATLIFQNGTQLRWWDIMAREQVPIGPLSGDKEKDIVTLALAIREREARREAEEQKKYA
jgi:hypothetical protein